MQVIQKCIEQMPPDSVNFIIRAVGETEFEMVEFGSAFFEVGLFSSFLSFFAFESKVFFCFFCNSWYFFGVFSFFSYKFHVFFPFVLFLFVYLSAIPRFNRPKPGGQVEQRAEETARHVSGTPMETVFVCLCV